MSLLKQVIELAEVVAMLAQANPPYIKQAFLTQQEEKSLDELREQALAQLSNIRHALPELSDSYEVER